jgi:hypothetical protein
MNAIFKVGKGLYVVNEGRGNNEKLIPESDDNVALNTSKKSDYINDIFLHFYMKQEEIKHDIKSKAINSISFDMYRGNWHLYCQTAITNGITIPFFTRILFYIIGFLGYLISFFIIFSGSLMISCFTFFIRKEKSRTDLSAFSLIRSYAALEKMKFLKGEVGFLSDKLLKDEMPSIYSQFNYSSRISSLWMVPLYSIRDYFLIIKDSKDLLGVIYTGFILLYFSMRVPQKCIMEFYLGCILKNKKQDVKHFFTGNKEDRFAILEKRLCKKYHVPVTCIPHGIEYSFKTPAGLVGDKFYCSTRNAADHLSLLYEQNNRFVFDEKIASAMFCKHEYVKTIEGIVFFPESREPEINLLIMQAVIELGFSLTVKLHPLDTEKNYCSIASQVTFTKDFNFAISNHICLARKSTVLVEAIYNNSIPIAVLIDKRDRFFVEQMLPSLADDKIRKVLSYKELEITLKELGAQRLN